MPLSFFLTLKHEIIVLFYYNLFGKSYLFYLFKFKLLFNIVYILLSFNLII